MEKLLPRQDSPQTEINTMVRGTIGPGRRLEALKIGLSFREVAWRRRCRFWAYHNHAFGHDTVPSGFHPSIPCLRTHRLPNRRSDLPSMFQLGTCFRSLNCTGPKPTVNIK